MLSELLGLVLIPGGFIGACYVHAKITSRRVERRQAMRRHPAGRRL